MFINRKSADHLIEESGCVLEHPSATKFRHYVMSGDWIKADHYLQELQTMIERKQNNIVVNILSYFLNVILPYTKWFPIKHFLLFFV